MGVRGIEHSFGIVGADATFFDTDFFLSDPLPGYGSFTFPFCLGRFSKLEGSKVHAESGGAAVTRNTHAHHVLTRSDRFRRVLRHSNTALRDGGRAEQEVANGVE